MHVQYTIKTQHFEAWEKVWGYLKLWHSPSPLSVGGNNAGLFRAFNTAGPAGEGGGLPPLPPPWLAEGRLSLSHFYILKSDYTLLKLEEALFHTVQTVAADLLQWEHIPKMQNDIGHKSKLRMLSQRGGKEAGGALAAKAVPRRAALGLALRSAYCICSEFKPDRIWRIRQP
jgi:hypothetical protein